MWLNKSGFGKRQSMWKPLLVFTILLLTPFPVSAIAASTPQTDEAAATPPITESRTKHSTPHAGYLTEDEWINRQVRDCIDRMGNRNGKAEPWEIEKFADECR